MGACSAATTGDGVGQQALQLLVIGRVLGLDTLCKLDVAFEVVVPTEDLGVTRKGFDPREIFCHLCGCSLEELSTSTDEHGVAGEQSSVHDASLRIVLAQQLFLCRNQAF